MLLKYNNIRKERGNIEIFIFKFFVFTLSLGHFIELPFGDFYSKIVPQFSTSVMFVGFIFLLPKLHKVIDFHVLPFVKFWFFSVIYTFLACSFLVILYSVGFTDQIDRYAWNLETPYAAAMRDLFFWLCCIMTLIYCYYNLRFIVSFDKLGKIIELSIWAVLIVGVLQLGVLNGISVCSTIYYGCSIIFKLVDFNSIEMLERGICFWGSEPASASALTMFILPYSIITFIKAQKWRKIRFGIYVFILLFLMLHSGSSSTLITSLIVLACTLLYILKKTIKTWVYLVSFSFGLVVALLYSLDVKITSTAVSSETNSIDYIILGKVLDRENGSTATRVATVCNDMRIFASYPLTGVGNGCQGFFYKNNIPDWTKFSDEVKILLYYEGGVIANGGGNFFASYFSGFGLIGAFVLLLLVRRFKLGLKKSIVSNDPIAKFTFAICIVIFLLAGWYVQTIEDNRLMFMLALGCVPNSNFLKNRL